MAACPYHVGDSALCTSHKFGAFRGKLSGNKTTPTGALTPNVGASPTVKESTDG